MAIKINGREVALEGIRTLADLVKAKELVAEHIVIEYNREIVPQPKWAGTFLKENDSIEVVSFVGGG